MNRAHCGLHLYGNVVPVTRDANRLKAAKHYRDFVEDPDRLERIEAFVRASGYWDTLAVARSAVRTLLAVDPGFAEAWALHLAHELQATRLRTEILSLRTVAERLDAWMAWNGDGVPPRGTRRAIASEIGTSPEALYRELARRGEAQSPTR